MFCRCPGVALECRPAIRAYPWLLSETPLGSLVPAKCAPALGKGEGRWLRADLVWLLNRVVLIPFRRAKDSHWTERARAL